MSRDNSPAPDPADPPTIAGLPTVAGPPTVWVGRASARPTANPPVPEEPMYLAAPRRSGRSRFLIVAGVLAACCAGGATLTMVGGAVVRSALFGQAGEAQRNTPAQDRDDDGDSGNRGNSGNGNDGTGRDGDTGSPGLATPVRDGKFEFVVTSVSCGHRRVGTLVTKDAQGQFCIVDLRISNIGTDAQTFTDVFQKARGGDGTVYGADTGAGVIANAGTGALWQVIDPGQAVTGKIVYDLPAGEEVATLELHDSLLSGGATVTVTG